MGSMKRLAEVDSGEFYTYDKITNGVNRYGFIYIGSPVVVAGP